MKMDVTKMIPMEDNDMRAEYDFTDGVRGKNYKAMQAGYTMTIHETDGKTVVKEVMPKEDAVILEPDVKACFPDSESVNTTLRCLIPILSQRQKAKVKKAK